jgi:hypothetical protein
MSTAMFIDMSKVTCPKCQKQRYASLEDERAGQCVCAFCGSVIPVAPPSSLRNSLRKVFAGLCILVGGSYALVMILGLIVFLLYVAYVILSRIFGPAGVPPTLVI